MRRVVLASLVIALAACRGEPTPRDYQNAPPAMMHSPQKKSQTPAQNGMPAAAPEPNSGVEGKNITRQPESPVPPSPKLKDQSPVTTTT